MEYKNSYLADSVYNHNAGGLVGGYPVMHVIDSQNTENKMLGGSTEIGASRFENLVVPIGLTSAFYGGENAKKQRQKAKDMGCIDDDMFDRLFGMVTVNEKANQRTTKKHMPFLFKNQSKKRK